MARENFWLWLGGGVALALAVGGAGAMGRVRTPGFCQQPDSDLDLFLA